MTRAQIFLSYPEQDREKVAAVHLALSREGYRPWMADKDMLPGEHIARASEAACEASDIFLAFVSHHSMHERGLYQSQLRGGERILDSMLRNDIFLIPVLLEECEMPAQLKSLWQAKLYEKDGWARLLEAIRVGLERRRGVPASSQKEPGPIEPPAEHEARPEPAEPEPAEPETTEPAPADAAGGRVEGRQEERQKERSGGVLFSPIWRSAVNRLPLSVASEHFVIFFGLRDPEGGPGLGADGVRDRTLVLLYLQILERCYEMMSAAPFRRQPPVVGPQGKTLIYVCDSEPFTVYDLQMVPYAVLPSRYNEVTFEAEARLAAAEAVHQVVHLFNYRERPYWDMRSLAWEWFDGALSSYMETVVLPDNVDHFRFLNDWIARPEVPLDEHGASHHALVFIHYLASRLGPQFVNDVWTRSSPEESPFEAIARMLPAGLKLSSAEPDEADVFSGYCADSYFLLDPSSRCFMPLVHERFGGRAVAESFALDAGDEGEARGVLDHLACRYYRLYPAEGVARVRVRLRTEDATAPLRAEVAAVTKGHLRAAVSTLRPVPPEGEGAGGLLSAELFFEPDGLDHLVVVVANCGLRGQLSHGHGAHHDDEVKYVLAVSAL